MPIQKDELTTLVYLNLIMLVFLGSGFVVMLGDIRHDAVNRGLSYEVTTIINGVETVEVVDVQMKFNFAMVLGSIVLINVVNVNYFRGLKSGKFTKEIEV